MAVTWEMSATRRMLNEGLESRLFYCGAQVYVSVGGECALDYALGLATPRTAATTDHIFHVWCSTKPIAALATLHLAEAGVLDLDRPFESIVPEWAGRPIGSVTARSAMAHRAGLPPTVPVLGCFLLQSNAVAALGALDLWDMPDGVMYAPVWGFMAINVVLRVLGVRLEEIIQTTVLDPLEISDCWLPITSENLSQGASRIGMNWVQTRNVLRPYPSDGLEVDSFPDFGQGGYASARALGRFYEAMLTKEVVERGIVSESTYEMMLAPAGPEGYDPIMQRPCTYGLGVMVDMSKHGFGDACSASSFGHSGGTGEMLAFADPRDDLVVVATFPTVEIDTNSAISIASRRPHFVQTIRRDLSLLPPTQVD